jgi:hypothetical protein
MFFFGDMKPSVGRVVPPCGVKLQRKYHALGIDVNVIRGSVDAHGALSYCVSGSEV